jgi:hypothetical protein
MKATDTRPKDDADFSAVFPLAPEAARWLASTLQRDYPDHHWLPQ